MNKNRMLLKVANEVLNCADADSGRFGIDVPPELALKFAHVVRHIEGGMDLFEDCEVCNKDKGSL